MAAQSWGDTQTRICTRPVTLRPAPLRLPPCELRFTFDFEDFVGSSGFINEFGVAGDQSLTAIQFSQAKSLVQSFHTSAFPLKRIDTGSYAKVMENVHYPAQARAGVSWDARSIKHHESDAGCPIVVLNGAACLLEPSIPGPNLAIEMEASGKVFQERSLNWNTATAPERLAIPIRPAAVELLRHPPAGDIFTAPVPAMLHLRLVHARTLNEPSTAVKAENQA